MEITEVRIKLLGKNPGGGPPPEDKKGPGPGDDPEPFSDAWLMSRFPKLVAMLERKGFNPADAQDAAQFAVIKAIPRPTGCKGDTIGKPDLWLRKVAFRAALTIERKRKQRRECSLIVEPLVLPFPALEQEEEDRHCHAAIQAALDRLPEKLRTVLLLHYFEGRSLREIGKMPGLNFSAARYRLVRARQILRAELWAAGFDLPESA